MAPNSWRAHNFLASALLQQKSYADAVSHAERAMELGKEQDHFSALFLGQGLAAQQLNEQAIKALQTYLDGKPPTPQAEAAQRIIERLENLPGDAAFPRASNPALSSAIPVAERPPRTSIACGCSPVASPKCG
jgi:tetratricopeptide (TPR) repeat protein